MAQTSKKNDYIDTRAKVVNQTDVPLSLISLGLHIADREKTQREKEVSEHGLGVVTAAIFLAGEMAGSGVLALPFAMKGTST